jgi:hypothetical protein
MKDLKNPAVIWLKGALFLVLGVASAGLLLVEASTIKVAVLLALTVWGFCRAYYFAFYVIEHYVDPGYRFSGLLSFARYLIRKKPVANGSTQPPTGSSTSNVTADNRD